MTNDVTVMKILRCFPDDYDGSDVTEPKECISAILDSTSSSSGNTTEKKKKKRKPSDWNLAVKDCHKRDVGMKECSTWWKSLDSEEKQNVVAKYK